MKAEIPPNHTEETENSNEYDITEINTRLEKKYGSCTTREEIIHCHVNGKEYCFPYETNRVISIDNKDIIFTIIEGKNERCIFINRDYISSLSRSAAYRWFIEGLMKEPFRFIFPFKDEFQICTKKGENIRIWTEPK